MFRGKIVTMALAWTLLAVSLAPAVQVTAVGFGGDKESALEDAKRNAVARAMGEYVDSRTLVQNFALVSDRILSSSNGYLKSYEVTSRASLPDGQVQMTIVAEVEDSMLRDDLGGIQVLSARRGFPRFVVVPDKEAMKLTNVDQNCIVSAGDGIEAYLAARGFGTILAPYHMIERGFTDPDALADLSQWAAGLGAEYIVYFTVSLGEQTPGRVFQRSDARVQATVVHTGTYRVIANVVSRGQGGDQNANFAEQDACRGAGENAATDAVDAVLGDWTRTGSVNGNELSLEIKGIPDDAVINLEESLRNAGALKQVNLASKDAVGAVYRVRLDGTAFDLGNAFEQVASNMHWQVMLTQANPTGLTYAVVFK